MKLTIAGAGPAGSSAAISAIQCGASVELFDRSHFPRHKVCGEFLSPGIEPLLQSLGVWSDFCGRAPARIRRMELHFRGFHKKAMLPEQAWGLSRHQFDQILLAQATAMGATLQHQARTQADIVATGRSAPKDLGKGQRLFGFKTHFAGPPGDAVELYFFRGCYVGINAIEGGLTNVCGLGPESRLREVGFAIDELLDTVPALRERLAPLTRSMEWMNVGPLVFRNRFTETPECYLTGDALSFVDPFTGSGLLSSVLMGRLAGSYAARGLPVSEYMRECRRQLAKPFAVSSLLRQVAGSSLAGVLASMVPARLLFAVTRPA